MPMREFLVVVLSLAGCGTAWAYASAAHFAADSSACARQASASLPADSVGRRRDREYNRAYGDCMRRRGYTEQAWVEHQVPGLP